jgi:hypothetical protein
MQQHNGMILIKIQHCAEFHVIQIKQGVETDSAGQLLRQFAIINHTNTDKWPPPVL